MLDRPGGTDYRSRGTAAYRIRGRSVPGMTDRHRTTDDERMSTDAERHPLDSAAYRQARLTALAMAVLFPPAMLWIAIAEGLSIRWLGALAMASFVVGIGMFRMARRVFRPADASAAPSWLRSLVVLARDALAWAPIIILQIELLRPFEPAPWAIGATTVVLVVAVLAAGAAMSRSREAAAWIGPMKNALAALAMLWIAAKVIAG
jgi:hypothetical protein